MDKYWIVQTLENIEEKKKRKIIKHQQWMVRFGMPQNSKQKKQLKK